MSEELDTPEVSYEVRVSTGCAGTNPEAPDWEVCEMENGEVKNNADIFDNMTLAEATSMADMWTRKKEEAGL